MSRYRKVDLRIWGDDRVRRLSIPKPNGRDCWLYLLTAKETTILPGAIPAGPAALSESLRWPLAGFRLAFAEVEREGMAVADWEAGLVWVPKAMRHNPPENPNVAMAWGKAFADLPDCALKAAILEQVEVFLKDLGEGFPKGFRKGFGKSGAGAGTGAGRPAEPASLVLVPVEPSAAPLKAEAQRVFEHWVKVMGKAPTTRFVDERREAVEAQLRDGRTVEDLKRAIDGCARTPHNMGENTAGKKFNDLELICRNGLQVERFMENAEASPLQKQNAEAACRVL
jgi:hypothetical protein